MSGQDFIQAYGARYPDNVAEERSLPARSVQMHRLSQAPGSYEVMSKGLALSMVTAGEFEATLDVGGGPFRQYWRPNSFAVVPPGASRSKFDIPVTIETLNFAVSTERVLQCSMEAGAALDRLTDKGFEHPLVTPLIWSIWHELNSKTPLGTLYLDHAVDLLLMQLLRLGFASPGLERAVGGRDWRVRRAMEQLDARLSDDVGLAELAAATGLSTSHFAMLFRASTGLPPHRWLMKRRVERACEMLTDPRRSVTEIAHALGFASSQHLATVFKKHIGATPTEYRRERLS